MTTDNSRVGHTPGPWSWEDDRGIWEFEITAPDGTSICECDWYGGSDYDLSQLVANARLIAAAPELLEALESYADQLCEGWCEGSPDCAHFDDCGGCLARRVAFKATGAA